MKIKIPTIRQMGIANTANMPVALELSFFTGVVGFVGAVAITLILVLVFVYNNVN
jgi:hypothetical protein